MKGTLPFIGEKGSVPFFAFLLEKGSVPLQVANGNGINFC